MNENIKAYLAQNPKKAGVLFTVMLLLSQAGTAFAGNHSWYGP